MDNFIENINISGSSYFTSTYSVLSLQKYLLNQRNTYLGQDYCYSMIEPRSSMTDFCHNAELLILTFHIEIGTNDTHLMAHFQ